MASGVTFGKTIRKRIALPPGISLSFLNFTSFTAYRTVTHEALSCEVMGNLPDRSLAIRSI
jgi:hypothetical protein